MEQRRLKDLAATDGQQGRHCEQQGEKPKDKKPLAPAASSELSPAEQDLVSDDEDEALSTPAQIQAFKASLSSQRPLKEGWAAASIVDYSLPYRWRRSRGMSTIGDRNCRVRPMIRRPGSYCWTREQPCCSNATINQSRSSTIALQRLQHRLRS